MSRHDEWPLINIIMPLGLLVSLLSSICLCTHRVRLVYSTTLLFYLFTPFFFFSFFLPPALICLRILHPSYFCLCPAAVSFTKSAKIWAQELIKTRRIYNSGGKVITPAILCRATAPVSAEAAASDDCLLAARGSLKLICGPA